MALSISGYSDNLKDVRSADETPYHNTLSDAIHVTVNASDLNGVCVACTLFVAPDVNGAPGTWKAVGGRFNVGWFSSVTRQPLASVQGWVPAGWWYKVDVHSSLPGADPYVIEWYESVP